MKLELHPQTARQIEDYIRQPVQTLLVIGPSGSGKSSIASLIASRVLDISETALADHPYVRRIASQDTKAIPIEEVRLIERFLKLKVPGSGAVNRIVIFEDAQRLGLEAQNALLKTLEEPPVGTVMLLLAANEQALLPTIRSRAQTLEVRRPAANNLKQYFEAAGFEAKAVAQAHVVSAGLPGLMTALLNDEDHPLVAATTLARQLLGQGAYERLVQVDMLSKQKQLLLDTTFILSQMAHIRLQSTNAATQDRWKRVLKASYSARESLLGNANAKLVLTDLFISL